MGAEREPMLRRSAADLLFAVGYDEQAFKLFAGMVFMAGGSALEAEISLAISCVRAACSEIDEDASQAILHRLCASHNSLRLRETFLHRVLQVYIADDTGDEEHARSRIIGDIAADHSGAGCRMTLVEALLFKYGIAQYNGSWIPDSLRSDSLLEHCLDGQPALGVIRDCLAWCIFQLKQAPVIMPGLRHISARTEYLVRWMENLQICTCLWGQWKSSPYAEPRWATAAQEDLGISATELLAITCRLAGTHFFSFLSVLFSHSAS